MRRDPGFPKTAPEGIKKGTKGAMIRELLAIKAVAILLHSSAIMKLAGTYFRNRK